jgi:hypothetical protein
MQVNMPKEFRPGWEYIYSGALGQEVAVSIKTEKAHCEDGTIYFPEEIKILNSANQEITLGVHLVKRVFEGEIVNFIHKEN